MYLSKETLVLLANELVIDSFERIKQIVHKAVDGLSDQELAYRPAESANSIGWLVWHLTRIQDDHIADLVQDEQVWTKEWYKRFDLPFNVTATGYGHSAHEVSAVQVSSKLLLDYHDAVHNVTVKYVKKLSSEDYQKIVDKHWDPPVTLAIRLISVISDDLQHAGQAAYIRGLLKNA